MNVLTKTFNSIFRSASKNNDVHRDIELEPAHYRGFAPTIIDTIFGPVIEYWFNSNKDCCNWRYVRAYKECPPLSAVINYQADAFANGETWILKRGAKKNDKDNEVKNNKNADKIKKLLEQPNKYQTQSQFEAELIINYYLFGWCLLYMDKPIGYAPIDAESIHIISPSQIEFDFYGYYKNKNRGWDNVKAIWVCEDNGERRSLIKQNCYIIKDSIPGFCIGDFLPTSRLDTIKQPIQNIIDGLESRGVLLRERGMRGLITNETVDSNSFISVKDDEKKELMSELRRTYGTLKGQFQIAFSNKSLKYQKISADMKDLMLFEEDENSLGKICDAFKFPKQLLSNMGQGTTFSNMQTATRNLYQNAIIPLAKSVFEQLDAAFNTREYGFYIYRDYSGLSVLQPDQKEKAESLVRMAQAAKIAFETGFIDKNEARKMLDKDTIDGFDGVFYDPNNDKSEDIDHTHINDGTSMNTVNNEGTLNQTI